MLLLLISNVHASVVNFVTRSYPGLGLHEYTSTKLTAESPFRMHLGHLNACKDLRTGLHPGEYIIDYTVGAQSLFMTAEEVTYFLSAGNNFFDNVKVVIAVGNKIIQDFTDQYMEQHQGVPEDQMTVNFSEMEIISLHEILVHTTREFAEEVKSTFYGKLVSEGVDVGIQKNRLANALTLLYERYILDCDHQLQLFNIHAENRMGPNPDIKDREDHAMKGAELFLKYYFEPMVLHFVNMLKNITGSSLYDKYLSFDDMFDIATQTAL